MIKGNSIIYKIHFLLVQKTHIIYTLSNSNTLMKESLPLVLSKQAIEHCFFKLV